MTTVSSPSPPSLLSFFSLSSSPSSFPLISFSLFSSPYPPSLLSLSLSLSSGEAPTDLQPDVLGSVGDGGDLEGGLAVRGGQLAGVHVVFGGELGLDAHAHAVGRAAVWIGHLHLAGRGGAGQGDR